MLKLCKKNKLINVGAGGSESPCKIIRYVGESLPNDIQWNNGDLYINTTGGVNRVYKCVLDYDDGNDVTFVEDQFKQGYLYYNVYSRTLNLYDNGELVVIYDPSQNVITYEDLREQIVAEIDDRLATVKVDQILTGTVDPNTDEFYYEGDGVPVAITGIEVQAPSTVTPQNSELVYIDSSADSEAQKDIPSGIYLKDNNGTIYQNFTTANSIISSDNIANAINITAGNSKLVQTILPNGALSLKNN